MSESSLPKEIRNVLLAALPEETAVFGQTPDLKYTYVPAGHARALNPDSMLVVGMRGAGKSFWWSVLQSAEHRRLVAHLLPKTGIAENTVVSIGFGERPSPPDYPGKDTLIKLCETFDARQIWRAVVVWQLTRDCGSMGSAKDTWPERVRWVVDHPEEVEQRIFDADNELEDAKTWHLCLFDALDRCADDWPVMLKLIRGLLRVLLEFRAYKRIRPKAFVRPDHLEDPAVADFPDSSKVLTQRVELRWPRNELYGLLWQYVANEANQGSLFRDWLKEEFAVSWNQYSGVWTVPDNLRNDQEIQRSAFHGITGPWMGPDRRRGFPYSWLPSHLGDAYGQVSPRSFLAAIRHAAENEPREDYEYALYYESIKRGVQKASQIRVREMQEDYPWVETLMKHLAGLTVPCAFNEIAGKWETGRVLDQIKSTILDAHVRLPPTHVEEGAQGVRRDLEMLGVFERMTDGRVNMPDVYRVGYGMGRRGGVKAVARR